MLYISSESDSLRVGCFVFESSIPAIPGSWALAVARRSKVCMIVIEMIKVKFDLLWSLWSGARLSLNVMSRRERFWQRTCRWGWRSGRRFEVLCQGER